MKKIINEREINQKMVKVMKEALESNSSNTMTPTKSDVSKDQGIFRDAVAPDVRFTEFSILPDANNVIFKGVIPGICEWKFEFKNRDGVEITMTEPVKLTEEIITMFKRMNGIFDNWKNAWGVKLTEYQKTDE